jgi:ferredoxin
LIWIKDSLSGSIYPESMFTHSQGRKLTADAAWLPIIDRVACTGCGACIAACPMDALGQTGGKADLTRPEACTYCLACEDLCPVDAIQLPFLICTLETYQTRIVQPSHKEQRT